MSKLLYELIQRNSDGNQQEVMKKQLFWCDDYLEIMCLGLLTKRKYLFRLSSALVSVMIQRYYFNLDELWKLLINSAQVYVDRVLFSTEHIQSCPVTKDSKSRDAYLIHKTTKYNEKGEPWYIEMLTNIIEPFDLEIRVQLSAYWDRKHIYRIEPYLLKSYFEKYCLEMYVESEENLKNEEPAKLRKRNSVDFISFPKQPNYMLDVSCVFLFSSSFIPFVSRSACFSF
jgi:hypothetical protein